MTLTVTLDRTSLALADLVIGDSPPAGGHGFAVELGGVFEPAFDVRATYGPDSAYIAGSQMLAIVLAQSTLPLLIVAQAPSSAALAVLKAELAAALWQFSYEVTLTVDGVAQSWQADARWPMWGEVTSGLVAGHLAQATVVIPVNPS